MGLPYGEKFHHPNFNRFSVIHPSDRQTDGQTDGRAIAYSALSICYMRSRSKNVIVTLTISCTIGLWIYPSKPRTGRDSKPIQQIFGIVDYH